MIIIRFIVQKGNAEKLLSKNREVFKRFVVGIIAVNIH